MKADGALDGRAIFDIGSGAGFPGMALSIAGAKNMTLVESDARKCAFLEEAKRVCNSDAAIINDRVENLDATADIIIGRAFAPLDKFLHLCRKMIYGRTTMYLLKGNNIKEEIAAAKKNWNFDYILYEKPGGFIVKIFNITDLSA
jgi:16S rRNA (guanine527-N7)-methyltransferase